MEFESFSVAYPDIWIEGNNRSHSVVHWSLFIYVKDVRTVLEYGIFQISCHIDGNLSSACLQGNSPILNSELQLYEKIWDI